MTIMRIINGKLVEITLTQSEMWDAYREQEREFIWKTFDTDWKKMSGN